MSKNGEANVSLATIAEEVGVHASLVSRVLRADPNARISAKKRALILEVAEQKGYRPNRVAQSLRTRRTHILAMLTPDITNPFYSLLFRAVETLANRSGYHVILCNTDDDPERALQVVSTLCDGHVDGLLLATARDEDQSIDMLCKRKIPYVLLNRRRINSDDPWFGTESSLVGRTGAEHLLAKGHSRVAYLDGDMTVEQLASRKEAFLKTMAAAGHPVDEKLIVTQLITRFDASVAMGAILELPKNIRPTAVFVPRTILVDGVLDAVRTFGLRIPDDISVLGFSAVPDPVVTCVCSPIAEIGERAAEFLINRLKSQGAPSGQEQVAFDIQVVDRGTTAPPATKD